MTEKDFYVYKREKFSDFPLYLKEFNKRHPGDSVFTQDKSDALMMVWKKAVMLSRLLNSGIDKGSFRPYGLGRS